MSRRILIALVVPVFLAAAPDEEAVKKELKKLDGTWMATQTRVVDDNGKKVMFTQNFRLIIRGEDRFSLEQKFSDEKKYQGVAVGTFTIDPSKKPREMDMNYVGEGISKCIYELDANGLRLVGGKPGGDRPTAFDKERTLAFKREGKKK